MSEITDYLEPIQHICQRHHVRTLHVFGSATTDKFSSRSDIDFVVDIEDKDPMTYADNYFNLKFQLEQLFQRPIDLLEEKALRNPYLKVEIDKTKILLYGAGN